MATSFDDIMRVFTRSCQIALRACRFNCARYNLFTRYNVVMGKKKIEISNFGLEISRAIRSEMGIRRLSGRELAKSIGRGETYVRERVSDHQEWALSDIEKICELWDMNPSDLPKKA